MDWKNSNIWKNIFRKDKIEKYGKEYKDDIFNISINIYEVYLKVSSQYIGRNYTKDYTIFDGIYNLGIHPEYYNEFKDFLDAEIVKTYFVDKSFLNNNKNKCKLQYCFSFIEF